MGVLGILTVYANTLKWSFIDEKKKKKEVSLILQAHQNTFELTLVSVHELDAKR